MHNCKKLNNQNCSGIKLNFTKCSATNAISVRYSDVSPWPWSLRPKSKSLTLWLKSLGLGLGIQVLGFESGPWPWPRPRLRRSRPRCYHHIISYHTVHFSGASSNTGAAAINQTSKFSAVLQMFLGSVLGHKCHTMLYTSVSVVVGRRTRDREVASSVPGQCIAG